MPDGIRQFLDTVLGRRRDNPKHALKSFRRSLPLLTTAEQIANLFASTVEEFFRLPRVALFMLDEDENVFTPVVVKGFQVAPRGGYSFDDKVVNWLNTNRQHINLSAESNLILSFGPSEKERWQDWPVDWVFPLLNLSRLTGFLALGGRRLDSDSVEVLRTLTNLASGAIHTATLHKKQQEVADSFHRAEKLALAGQLAAAAAHEIRNPLTAIRSSIQYVAKSLGEDDKRRSMLDEVLHEVDRVNKVVEGLLTSVRPSAPAFRRVDLVELIEKVIEPFRLKPTLTIDLDLEERCREAVCDPDQIRQVLLNLVQNAQWATQDQGTITIALKLENATSDKVRQVSLQQYTISVSDNGPGIQPAIMTRIFDPFYTTRTKEEQKGTGLGLSICRGIIEKHGGELTARSVVGEGATFEIKLPVIKI